MLQVRELAVEVGARRVVEEASFTVRAGDKVGLVGRNGAGKTSLIKVLAGDALPAAGLIRRPASLGHVPQDPRPRRTGSGATALTHVLSGRELDLQASRLEHLRQRLEGDHSVAAVEAFSHAEEAFRMAGGYSADAEVRRITAGLGLRPDRVDLPLAALSGGERRRAEIARVLFGGGDLLLLDEPTNHLDAEGKEWLMGFLRGYRGGLLVVSHDLELLDSAITRILHLEGGSVVEYRGTYSQYLEARRLDEERRTKTAKRQDTEVRRLAQLAESMRHQSSKRARTAHALDKRVERLRADLVAAPSRERKIRVRFPPPPHSGRLVLAVDGLAKSYGRPVFADVTFQLERSQRLLVLGLNGAGKTTLLRILAGDLGADSGTVRPGVGVSTGYYAQEHEGIDGERSALANMKAQSAASEPELRALLGMFGLTGEMAHQDAGTFSGGEKTKLALGQLVAGRHNLLLLDEPTNNLDPPSREAVAAALGAWPGAMILVSHDVRFVEALRPDHV
ncbi:MAG: ABC-F family ATP-binding cassette domain-containing protein, partial [Candidatus Dormibacteraceae bacterium]